MQTTSYDSPGTLKFSGRTKKKAVANDNEASKAPRLWRRVLHGGPQPQWGGVRIPRLPVIRALLKLSDGQDLREIQMPSPAGDAIVISGVVR